MKNNNEIINYKYKHHMNNNSYDEINAPTKIKLIRELAFLLTFNPQHMFMQNLLKLMINCVNPRYIHSALRPILEI